jgi:hypothetical protein
MIHVFRTCLMELDERRAFSEPFKILWAAHESEDGIMSPSSACKLFESPKLPNHTSVTCDRVGQFRSKPALFQSFTFLWPEKSASRFIQMKTSGVRTITRLTYLCSEALGMADCHRNGRIKAIRPDLTYICPNFASRVPGYEYLFIVGLLWDFPVEKCEFQYILSYSNRSNLLALMALSYRFSEKLFTILHADRNET